MAPPADPTGERDALRARLVAAAAAMIRDGLSRIYRPRDYWYVASRVERRDPRAPVEYLDYGEWHPVPKKYDVVGDVHALLAVAKRSKPRSEIRITRDGIVNVDRQTRARAAAGAPEGDDGGEESAASRVAPQLTHAARRDTLGAGGPRR